MTENESMWAEEQGDTEKAPVEQASLRSVGVTPGGIQTDLDAAEVPADDMGMEGGMPADGAMDTTGVNSPMAGGPVTPMAGGAPAPM